MITITITNTWDHVIDYDRLRLLITITPSLNIIQSSYIDASARFGIEIRHSPSTRTTAFVTTKFDTGVKHQKVHVHTQIVNN